jgi:hypothetical protein
LHVLPAALLATGFAMLNAVERTQGRRVFWVFIAAGYGLWALDQWIYVYYFEGPDHLREGSLRL